MKKNNYQTIYVASVMILLVLGCNLGNMNGPASLKNLKVSSDKEGRVETREFKPGDTIYATAEVSGKTENTMLLFVVYNQKEQMINESKMKLTLKQEKVINYSFKIPPDMPSGKYYINANLLGDNESGGIGVSDLRKAIEVK
jgi:hypothetical protein